MFLDTAAYPTPAAMCADMQHASTAAKTPEWASGHVTLKPYAPTPEITESIDALRTLHKKRQAGIRANTKLALQAQAILRLQLHDEADYEDEASKDAARKRTESLYKAVAKDPDHPLHPDIMFYLMAMAPLDEQRKLIEKETARIAKTLPVFEWVKSVKGFGVNSFATIVGECGDIGTYKSVSAVWKRLGLAVLGGNRQGSVCKGGMPDDSFSDDVLREIKSGKVSRESASWIVHGYNPARRSVSWNMRQNIIGGMGKFRPVYGEDVQANEELTYYQRVYAERLRYDSIKAPFTRKVASKFEPVLDDDGEPVTMRMSDKGKESYSAHCANRAHRYVEKRLLKHLYLEWRRA